MRPFDPSPESVRTSTVSDVVQRPTEQRPSVLLADDDERFRSIVRSVLEDDGYKVVAEAADATETIERARQHRPDVVVLDLVMTGSVGLRTARALLADQPFRPVLVFSSLFDPMIEQEAISLRELGRAPRRERVCQD